MKTTLKKSILSAAFMLAICSVCFTANGTPVITSASDTSKMAKMDKMKMAKPDKMKKKKMDKMSKDKMSSGKMSKDTSKM